MRRQSAPSQSPLHALIERTWVSPKHPDARRHEVLHESLVIQKVAWRLTCCQHVDFPASFRERTAQLKEAEDAWPDSLFGQIVKGRTPGRDCDSTIITATGMSITLCRANSPKFVIAPANMIENSSA